MRLRPALAIAAMLLMGACQNPDGSLNVPASLALGAGAALGVAAIASASDNGHSNRGYYNQPSYGYHRQPSYGYAQPSYGYSRPYYGRGYGHNNGYRRW